MCGESHRQGRLSDAEPLYLQILRQDTNQFEAKHLLGVLGGQQGRYQEALELIGVALAVKGEATEARQNYALILHKMGRHEHIRAAAIDGSRVVRANPSGEDTPDT
jgi:tetratricopeptide (TPR) repeat protein